MAASDKLSTTSLISQIVAWVRARIAEVWTLIPLQASSSNQLADKAFVNSSISTITATFRGTYNLVSDLSLTTSATHSQIAAALDSQISTVDNNDYAFVQIPTSGDTPTQIAKTEKYKYNGSIWAFEYELNNSGFTAAQWAAINSGATLELIGKLSVLPTNAELTALLNNKANKATIVNQTASSASISPNVLNVWGVVSSLSITFAAGAAGEVNEYRFQFTCPFNAATALTLPSQIRWANDDALDPKPGYTYQVSVENNLAIYAGWEAPVQ